MQTKHGLMCLGVAVILTACGDDKSSEPKQPAQDAASADLTKDLDCSEPLKKEKETADKKEKDNDSAKRASLLKDSKKDKSTSKDEELEPRRIPADALRLTQKKGEKSMCDVLRGTEKKLALFSFLSSKCEACQDRTQEIAKAIEEEGVEEDVIPVVIVMDALDAKSEKEWAELKDEVAPDAFWGFDKSGDIWRFFAGKANAGKKVQPWVIAMDVYATGFIDKNSDHSLADVIEEANDLLSLDIGVDKDEDDVKTSTRTAVKTSTATSTSTRTTTSSNTQTTTVTGTNTGTSTGTATTTRTSTSTATSTAVIAAPFL